MLHILALLVLASLVLPSLVGAEIVIYNEGSVVSETHSSASTGGQRAQSGQTVTTGDVSSSSHVETVINAGSDGGTVYVKTETTKNGETEVQEYTKEVEPQKPVDVHVSAKATSEESKVEVRAQGEFLVPDVATGTTLADAEGKTESVLIKSLKAVPNFFRKVFDFLWW